MKITASLLVVSALAAPALIWGCSSSPTNDMPDAGSGGGSTSSSSSTSGMMDAGTVDAAAVARGEYLVDHVLCCGECHTPVDANGNFDKTKYLAGSRSYDFNYNGQIISVYAENLTPDAIEGIGTWSDDLVRGAIAAGLDDQKVPLWPIMPYPEYALMTDDDVHAIIAYLRTIKSSNNTVPPDTLADPGSPAAPINGSLVPHTTLAKTDPDYASAERGRYLATIACVNCHTPQISPGIPDLTKAFAGGRTYRSRSDTGYSTSTNLTPDATGLAGWSVDDIVQSIKTNTEKGTNRALCTTMPGGPGRMGDIVDQDLKDLANYFHTIPPIQNGPFKCDMYADGGVPDGG